MTPASRLLQAYQVGNLSEDSRFDHYELRSGEVSTLIPSFTNYGRVYATSSYTSFAVAMDNHAYLTVQAGSTLVLMYGGNFTSNSSTKVLTSSELIVGGGAELFLRGTITGSGSVQILSGAHLFPYHITAPSLNLIITTGAFLR